MEGKGLRGLVWLCPSRPRDTAVHSRFDEVVEGRIIRGLVLLCHLPPLLTLQHSPVGTFEWRVWAYRARYSCASSRPRDAAVFFRFDKVIKGIILRGLVFSGPLPLYCYCSIVPFDGKVEGMILRGLVVLWHLPDT